MKCIYLGLLVMCLLFVTACSREFEGSSQNTVPAATPDAHEGSTIVSPDHVPNTDQLVSSGVKEPEDLSTPAQEGESSSTFTPNSDTILAETIISAPLPLSGAKIGLDAGHQLHGVSSLEPIAPGSDEKKAKVLSGTKGCVTGIAEHELNLQISLLLEQNLVDLGAEVVMVRRTADVNISSSERAIMMNEAEVDFFIRIHANGSESSKTKGAMILIPAREVTKDINEESRHLGEVIFDSYLAATGAANAGVIYSKDMTGFNWSKVPVCLIEMGFMTNPEEDKLLNNPEYQEKIVQGLTDGIMRWYELKTTESQQ
jgi:N-acetylmuramoyl-L-alanine amidase